MNKLIEIFCDVDDFCHQFLPEWEAQLITDGTRKRRRCSKMSTSERITIMIAFHQSNHEILRTFILAWLGVIGGSISLNC